MSECSPVFLKKFKNTVDRILHVPGNFTMKVLEMTVVVDTNLPKEKVEELLPQLVRTLKMHSDIFRNVRFNYVTWNGDEDIRTKVCPMQSVMLMDFYREYKQIYEVKSYGPMIKYLKTFHARAKLIIILTDGEVRVVNEEMLKKLMQPFLDKKLMKVILNEAEVAIEYRS